MKRNTLLVIFLLMLLTISMKNYAQNSMLIQLKSGSVLSYTLASTSKISFLNNNLLYAPDNSSTAIDQITKITFGVTSGTNDVNENNVTLGVSPNPAHDYIVLTNLISSENGKVSIYSATGVQVILRQISSSTETVDVSSLPQGIYIVRVNNQTAKFIKL